MTENLNIKQGFFDRYKWALDELEQRFGSENIVFTHIVPRRRFRLVVKCNGRFGALTMHQTDHRSRVIKCFDRTDENEAELDKFIKGFGESG